MIGDSNVGKTSLVLRYDTSIFSSRFVTTIGVDYRDKTITLGSTPIRLQLWGEWNLTMAMLYFCIIGYDIIN